jgi:oxygen-independent coproporphyrinogen-3 oxidase
MNRPHAFALYLHIPFCAARCHYCDFNTYAGLEGLFEPYGSALALEVRRAGEARTRPPARTIFIGGGTPTVLPVPLLAQALDASRDAFDLDPAAEITCEANPGTTDRAHFTALHALGINRLSLGIQSFDDQELRWLGRIHTATEAGLAFSQARAAGFEDINLDLIFGLPGQSPANWRRTLERAIALGPEHLSLYSLTVEPGTPLGRQVGRGLIPPPDDDLAADLYQLACGLLAEYGYIHYEISNWAKSAISYQLSAISHSPPLASDQSPAHPRSLEGSGFQLLPDSVSASGTGAASSFRPCQHNLVYWRREPYLGFGAGAHSFEGERRWWNVRAVPRYLARMAAGREPRAGGERIGRRVAMAETMMLGLRLLEEGVPGGRFRTRFGVALDDAFGPEIDRLAARGQVERLADRVRLTPAAWLLANRVFAEFMEDDDGP